MPDGCLWTSGTVVGSDGGRAWASPLAREDAGYAGRCAEEEERGGEEGPSRWDERALVADTVEDEADGADDDEERERAVLGGRVAEGDGWC